MHNADVASDLLLSLRDTQESERKIEHVPWAEWRKAGSPGPGFGMMGHLNTSSNAPAGPYSRPPGNRMVGKPSVAGESRYNQERQTQPPPWIDDVDMANVWYSPFEPVWPFGPPSYTRPREWNFPVGYNLNFIQNRMEMMGMLRGMRDSWGVLSTVIETRKDQLLRLPWTIQRRDKPRASSTGVETARKFFRRPDGKLSYNQWTHKLLDDLFVIDAPCVYMDRAMGGTLKHAEVLDGSFIFPLIDDAGRRPSSTWEQTSDGVIYEQRQPAFQQIVYGLPMLNLSEDELLYAMMRPRPDFPVFGYSPVQQIMTEATEAIRKTFYQLEFWRAGSIPELIITVPENWTPRQIASFQAHFDALLSGQLSLKSKVRFVPGGMKPFDIKNADGNSLWSERDEILIRLACYAFSVSPTPFIKQTNRATAQNAQQTSQEEGLYPLMSWWKDDIMDVLIQDYLGMPDVEFMFLPRPEVDLLKQAQIHQIKINTGEMTRDEARAENGEEPYGDGLGSVPTVSMGAAVMPLESIISGDALVPGAPAPPPSKNVTTPRPTPQNVAVRGSSRGRNTSPQPPMKPTSVHKVDNTVDTKPTPEQKQYGNYRKRHFNVHGLSISIENEKGSTRQHKDAFGVEHETEMTAAYGYIRGTIGADGAQMDVYVGKKPGRDFVYVIDQDKYTDGKDSGFDEHKVMMGFKTLDKALQIYLESHYDDLGHERLAAVTFMSIGEFKKWLAEGDLNKPAAESGYGHVIARRGVNGGITSLGKAFVDALIKGDTISSATGLTWYDQTTATPRKRKRKKKKRSRGTQWLQLNAI